MKNFLIVSVLSVLVLAVAITGSVFAQNALDPTPDPATALVGWVCANQGWVVYIVGGLIAHTGFSFLSAGLKKFGIAPEMVGPIAGKLVQVIRIFAVDVKPPAAIIVAQAAGIMATSDSTAAQATAPAVAQAAADMKVQTP